MTKNTHIDKQAQLDRWRQAVDLLGGQRASARYLNVNERHIRRLVAGDRDLHTGILRDTAAALVEHAASCRDLERQLSPAFTANLTAHQAERLEKLEMRRFDPSTIHDAVSYQLASRKQRGKD